MTIIGYQTRQAQQQGETCLEGRVSLSFAADASMIPTKADATRLGKFIQKEIDQIVNALMLEKETSLPG